MKRELDYFWIEDSYGGNQEWFTTFMMRLGGCAAQTACDSCIYFAKQFGMKYLYSYQIEKVNRKEYVEFSNKMKRYISPRLGGVSKLHWYVDGFRQYLKSVGDTEMEMDLLSGGSSFTKAKQVVQSQIDKKIPVPFLLLKHRNLEFSDYTWHWFLVIGYEGFLEGEKPKIKIVTYSKSYWLPFDELWRTGYTKKGGLILYRLKSNF